MIKRILSGIVLMGFAVSVQATLIEDNFNRANAAYSADVPATIGGDWINGGYANNNTNAQFRIQDNRLEYGVGSASVPVINTGLETESGAGVEFTLSATHRLLNPAINGGLVWNYQNPSNYYTMRFMPNTKTIQVLSLSNAVWTAFKTGSNASFPAHVNPSVYEMSVYSDTAYSFDIYFRDVTSSETIEFTATDPGSNFVGGYAGFLSTSGGNTGFDDFRLEVIPEPATVGLLGLSLLALFARRRLSA